MKDRTLSFDHIPVIFRCGRTQHLGGPCNEISDHCVHWDSRAGDQNPGLSGGTKVRAHTARLKSTGDRQRGVLLAEGAVRADREQSLAASFDPGRNRDAGWWLTHVDEAAVQALGDLIEPRVVSQSPMQSAHEVQSRLERLVEYRHPAG